jgi:hypothetical protein
VHVDCRIWVRGLWRLLPRGTTGGLADGQLTVYCVILLVSAYTYGQPVVIGSSAFFMRTFVYRLRSETIETIIIMVMLVIGDSRVRVSRAE